MLMTRSDHKVRFRREELLADTALLWRREAGNENLSYFNIIEFLEKVLLRKIKRPFKIKFFDASEGEKPAYVTFDRQTTLHVDSEVWRLAELGEPDARFIIAHEIGHLLLHDHDAKAFSNSPDDQIKYAQT